MSYIFDTCALIDLFKHYHKDNKIMDMFNDLIEIKKISSVREVYKEIEKSNDLLSQWAKENKEIFKPPEIDEFYYISKIFKRKHFKMMIRKQQILLGTPVADPFIIAKAKYVNGYVVTNEKYLKNSAKVPNVCEYLDVKCISLNEFIHIMLDSQRCEECGFINLQHERISPYELNTCFSCNQNLPNNNY